MQHQNVTFVNFLIQKIRQFWVFCFKIKLFEKAEKMQNVPFSRSNMIHYLTFVCKRFQYLARFEVLNSKWDTLYTLYFKAGHVIKVSFKNWCIVKFCLKSWHFISVWVRNLMHLEFFKSKCNALYITKLKTILELKI